MIDQMPEGNNSIAMILEILEVGFEGGRGDGHSISNVRSEAVIEENRYSRRQGIFGFSAARGLP
jgi:hypothetical protein